MSPAEPSPEATELHLPRWQFWGCFGISLAIFLFGTGPVWEHPWNIPTFDLAVYWSYAPIPVLVLAGLAWSRRLGWKSFFLNVMEVTLLKYSVTFVIALFLWEMSPPTADAAVAPHRAAHADELPPLPPPTVIPPGRTGTLRGEIRGPDGRPSSGALVHVASGLDDYVFAVPTAALILENDGNGIHPRAAVAMAHQPLLGRSTDGHLHTLVASRDGAALFNVPMISAGGFTRVTVREAHGVVSLRCTVHPSEPPARLAVLSHPFAAVTGATGRFELEGVPAGTLVLSATSDGGAAVSREVVLEAGGSADVQLTLPGS